MRVLQASLAVLTLVDANGTDDLYINVVPADSGDCLEKVLSLPVREYEFIYDTVAGRRQLGVLGHELSTILPESVEVRAGVFANPTKGMPPITVPNVAYVDKNVLFMHNVGATQELMRRQDTIAEKVSALLIAGRKLDELAGKVGEKMALEADEQALERLRTAQAEAEKQRLQAKLAQARLDEEQRMSELAAREATLRLEGEAELRRRRLEAEAAADTARTKLRLQLEEESARRTDELRRTTDAELLQEKTRQERALEEERAAAELRRVSAEAKARAAAERENEELELRRIRAQGEEDRRRLLEGVAAVGAHLGAAALSLLQNPARAAGVCVWLVSLALGYFTVREAALLARGLLEARLGRPSLVRETSRQGNRVSGFVSALFVFVLAVLRLTARLVFSVLLSPWRAALWFCRACYARLSRCGRATVSAARAKGSPKGGRAPSDGSAGSSNHEKLSSSKNGGANGNRSSGRAVVNECFADVILEPQLREQVLSLAAATRNARRNGAPYRHLLLYGPPGTGKTMVAKRLATASGMDWAVMSGGDVGPLGKAAVTELHKLFDWARRSRRGLLLFVDEAEAFLGSRGARGMSEETRNALNALLYQTGTASHHFMLVLATNRADDLDEAVLDRMDDSLLFPLPDQTSRAYLLAQYFRTYVHSSAEKRSETAETVSNGRSIGADAAAGGSGSARGSKKSGSTSSLADLRRRSWKLFCRCFGYRTGTGFGIEGVDEAKASAFASRLAGFSGREIAKLMLGVQNAAFGSEEVALTPALLEAVVLQKVAEHRRKAAMIAE